MHEFAFLLFKILAQAICQTVCQLSFRCLRLLFLFISLHFAPVFFSIAPFFYKMPMQCLCKSMAHLKFSFHLISIASWVLKFSRNDFLCKFTIIPLRFPFFFPCIYMKEEKNTMIIVMMMMMPFVVCLMCVTIALQCKTENWTKYIFK